MLLNPSPAFRPCSHDGADVSQELELRAGQELFPGYRLEKKIGVGGFAEVWESTSPLGRNVALKFMYTKRCVFAGREIHNIQAIKRLHNPHLTQIHQVWSMAGSIVISMELAEGSLMNLLEAYVQEYETAISADLACKYMTQAAEGIDFLNAHQHLHEGQRVGYQHGDIKPNNILIFGDKVKLADFGLAIPLARVQAERMPVGTVQFAAPEVFHGRLTDHSDQYSLAVSYCLLRGGRLPFPDCPESFAGNNTRPVPDLSMLTPAEQPIVHRGLAISPIDRWPTCIAMMKALSRLFGVPNVPSARH
jgi:serine/threonine-protein kinase